MDGSEALLIEVAGHPDLEQLADEVAAGRDCKLVRDGREVAVVTVVMLAHARERAKRPPGWKPTAEDIAASKAAFGGWANLDIDAEQMKQDIYRWRDESPTKPIYEL